MSTTTMPEADFDLSLYDEEYNKAEAPEPGEFEDLPAGKYQAVIETAGFRKSNAGRPMFAITMTVFAPKFKGRKIFRNYMLDASTQMPFLKGDLKLLGMEGVPLNEVRQRAGELAGKAVELTISYKDGVKDGKKTKFQNIWFHKILDVDPEVIAACLESRGHSGSSEGEREPLDPDDIPF